MSLMPSWWPPRWRRAASPESEGMSSEEFLPLCEPASVSGDEESPAQTYCTVVLVGLQTELTPLVSGAQEAMYVAQVLAGAAQAAGVRTVALEIEPAQWGPTVAGVRHRCDAIVEQTDFYFSSASLLENLCARRPASGRFILAGCEAHTWLLQAALYVMRQGHEVSAVQEACVSCSAQDAAQAMRVLQQAGATIVSVADVINGWRRCHENQELNALLRLIESTAAGGSQGWR